jgi:prepilin-type N-terminal cleavage/methylation domain-containing protein
MMIREIRKPNEQRPAFTLIELMVVIAIIALLVALSAGAVMRYLTTQKGNVTETTIASVDSETKKHWQKVIDLARNESLPLLFSGSTIDLAYGCSGDANVARVIYIKLKLLQQFPMNFDEVFKTSPTASNTVAPYSNMLPADPAYTKYLGQYGIVGSTTATQPFESAACLLMALQLDRSGMKLNTDLLKSSIKALPSGLPYLADGWEQPLAFYRWPTANGEVDALNKAQQGPALVRRDSQDPDGKLFDPGWLSGSGQATFIATIHDLPASGTVPPARYLVPVIASAGPNKKLGFDVWSGCPDPMSIQKAGVSASFLASFTPQPPPAPQGSVDDSNDNLYNFRLTLGGKGD